MAKPRVHIPCGKGYVCGARSWAAAAVTDMEICEKCVAGQAGWMRRCIKEHIKEGGLVTNPEKLIDRVLGCEQES